MTTIIKKYCYLISVAFCVLLLAFGLSSCKKMVAIPEPNNSLTVKEAYGTDALANSTIAGIYTQMINGGRLDFGSGALTIFCGLSSDELIDFAGTADANGYQFNSNTLLSTNGTISGAFWTSPYTYIYAANTAIEGLAASTGVHDSVRNELTGEAKFIRAFCYFYLTNLYGDVPLALTSDWNKTALMANTPQSQIYDQIIADLKDAQSLLPADYSVSNGERIRPNKWAATALLARVYLFNKKWQDAEAQATAVLNNSSLYSLDTLKGVFLKNSTETIWQLQQNKSVAPNFNGTWDGRYFIPLGSLSDLPPNIVTLVFNDWNTYAAIFVPTYYFSNQLAHAFESGDQRTVSWLDSTGATPSGSYYFSKKYTISASQSSSSNAVPQYYMVLRLAEQYLIRAEARAELGEGNAVDDLNAIRNRAGLANYAGSTDQASLLNAIYHERQVELFCEWGSRWLDLKRTEQANTVLSAITMKQPWSSNSLLYPIPLSELNTDPNLKQNTGY